MYTIFTSWSDRRQLGAARSVEAQNQLPPSSTSAFSRCQFLRGIGLQGCKRTLRHKSKPSSQRQRQRPLRHAFSRLCAQRGSELSLPSAIGVHDCHFSNFSASTSIVLGEIVASWNQIAVIVVRSFHCLPLEMLLYFLFTDFCALHDRARSLMWTVPPVCFSYSNSPRWSMTIICEQSFVACRCEPRGFRWSVA